MYSPHLPPSPYLDQQRIAVLVADNPTPPVLMPRIWRRMVIYRWLAANLLSLALQCLGLALSVFALLYVPLWPAMGTAFGLVMLRGYRIVPGLWLGSFLVYITAHSGLLLAVYSATLLSAQTLLLAWLCNRFISPNLLFFRYTVWMKFLGAVVVVTAVFSGALTWISYPVLSGWSLGRWALWLQWGLADGLGVVIFACVLAAWDAYVPQLRALQLRLWSLICSYGVTLAVLIAFVCSRGQSLFWLGLVSVLLVVWLSWYWEWCGAVAAVFMLSMVLLLAVFLHSPLYMLFFVPVDPELAGIGTLVLLALQLSLALTVVLGLTLGLRKQHHSLLPLVGV